MANKLVKQKATLNQKSLKNTHVDTTYGSNLVPAVEPVAAQQTAPARVDTSYSANAANVAMESAKKGLSGNLIPRAVTSQRRSLSGNTADVSPTTPQLSDQLQRLKDGLTTVEDKVSDSAVGKGIERVDDSYSNNLGRVTPDILNKKTLPGVRDFGSGVLGLKPSVDPGRATNPVQPNLPQNGVTDTGKDLQKKDTVTPPQPQGDLYVQNTTSQGQSQENQQSATGQTDTESEDNHVPTYEEFLQSTKDTYKETLDKTNEYIEQQRQAAVERAEQERERQIVDARSDYEQNKASYGANAEYLAQMGLQGGGWNDYMNAQAYAQQRATTQGANAEANAAKQNAEQVANQQRLDAQLSYQQNVLQADENLVKYKEQQAEQQRGLYGDLLNAVNSGAYTAEQAADLARQYGLSEEQIASLQAAEASYSTKYGQAMFQELLSYANSGAYNSEQLAELARQYGMTEEQIGMLQRSADAYSGKQNSALYAQLLDSANNGASYEQLKDLAEQYGLSEEQIKGLETATDTYKSNMYRENYLAVLSQMASGAMDAAQLKGFLDNDLISKEQYDNLLQMYINDQNTADMRDTIEDEYKSGNIPEDSYESAKKAWNDDIETGSRAFDNYDSYESAKKDYEDIINNPWCSEETKAALKKSFDAYEEKTLASNVSTGYNAHSSTVTLNTPSGKVTVTYGVNSKSLKKSSGNAVFNSDVYKNAGSGQVFIINGRPYVKLDNGDLGWVNDYLGQGAFENLLNTYKGTVYDFS